MKPVFSFLASGFLLLFSFSHSTVTAQYTVKAVTLDQLEQRLRDGGDTAYVVNFWATWCSPCVAEIPHFEKLQQQFKSRPLKVLLVSLDGPTERETAVIPYVKRKKLQSEVMVLNEADQQYYINKIDSSWSGTIPASLFVYNGAGHSPVRKLMEQEFTYEELTEAVHRLFL